MTRDSTAIKEDIALEQTGSNISRTTSGSAIPAETSNQTLSCSIYSTPPLHLSLLLGFQHFLLAFGAVLSIPFMLWPLLCSNDAVAFAKLVNTGIFVSGIVTILQSSVGIRLALVQGTGVIFVAPIIAILSLPKWECSKPRNATGYCVESNISHSNDEIEHFTPRILEIQGAVILASLVQVLFGVSGLIGVILHFIGPLVTATVISLLATALFGVTSQLCEENWPIAIMTMVVIILFSQYFRNIQIPCCKYDKGCYCSQFPLFQLFSVILAILFSWFLCWLFTISDGFPNDKNHWAYGARTDTKSCVLRQAKWFRVPYPGQWGTPTFSASSTFGMLSGVIAGFIDKIGNYNAAAKLSGAPRPPAHAINRGIFIDGLGSVLMGCWGSGSGASVYSENIAILSITKVGSPRVTIVCGCMMILLGTFGKLGALFITIPSPVIGGVMMVAFGIIVSVGVSNLYSTDMHSTRNMVIFGFSFFFGLSFTQWLIQHPHAIDTGSEIFNQVVKTLLSTSLFVGGITAFALDNSIPGTRKERGFPDDLAEEMESSDAKDLSCYDFPVGMSLINRWKWTQYFPVCPTFNGFRKPRSNRWSPA